VYAQASLLEADGHDSERPSRSAPVSTAPVPAATAGAANRGRK
jgi:hypothetical protein